jgi:hypothetical protein
MVAPMGLISGGSILLSAPHDPLAAPLAIITSMLLAMTTMSVAKVAGALMPEGPMTDIKKGFGCKDDQDLAYLFDNDVAKVKRFRRDDFSDAEKKEIEEVWKISRLLLKLLPTTGNQDFERRAKYVRLEDDPVLGRSIRDSVYVGQTKWAAQILEYRMKSLRLFELD